MNKVRPGRFLAFITIWSLCIYIPVARWSWYRQGVFNILGTMDFAGGTPVHIVSGTTVAAFSVFYSIETLQNGTEFRETFSQFLKRFAKRYTIDLYRYLKRIILLLKANFEVHVLGWEISDEDLERLAAIPLPPETEPGLDFEPYNVNYITLGTALLWFGWAGFNGGSALGGNLRAVSAWTCTHIAACSGGVTAVMLLWLRKLINSIMNWLGSRSSRADGDSDYDEDSSPTTARASSPATRGYGLENGNGTLTNEEAMLKQEKSKLFEDMTVLFFCDGVIAGLVAITPAAGYVRHLLLLADS